MEKLKLLQLTRLTLQSNSLAVQELSRGVVWLDTGTHDSLLEAAEFVSIIQKRQGIYISCIEEIAYRTVSDYKGAAKTARRDTFAKAQNYMENILRGLQIPVSETPFTNKAFYHI